MEQHVNAHLFGTLDLVPLDLSVVFPNLLPNLNMTGLACNRTALLLDTGGAGFRQAIGVGV